MGTFGKHNELESESADFLTKLLRIEKILCPLPHCNFHIVQCQTKPCMWKMKKKPLHIVLLTVIYCMRYHHLKHHQHQHQHRRLYISISIPKPYPCPYPHPQPHDREADVWITGISFWKLHHDLQGALWLCHMTIIISSYYVWWSSFHHNCQIVSLYTIPPCVPDLSSSYFLF